MRLRLSITLHITRDREQAEPEPVPDERPAIYDVSGAMVERSEPTPLGFRIPTPPAIEPVYERGEG